MDETYRKRFTQGEVGENELESLLISFGFIPIKNISKDRNGNTTWQQINLRSGTKRNLDFDVFERENSFAFKAEAKQLTSLYRKNPNKFLTIEKAKLDDYIEIQSELEEECFIFFLIGKVFDGEFPDGYDLYWNDLQSVYKSIVDCGDVYSSKVVCYVLDKTNYKKKEDLFLLNFMY